MRPTLPRIPTRAVSVLSVAWITKLINCLKYAMETPQGDGKTTYRHGETISALRQAGNALGGTSGDTYNGYFKVIKTATGYSVIYGADPAAVNCGYVIAGNLRLPVLKTDFLTADVSENGVFFIETNYTTAYQVTIKFAADLSDGVDGKDICLINELKDKTPIQHLFGEHKIMRWV